MHKTLVPSAELLRVASLRGQAVAALNFYNAETLRAHIGAARAASASIILQTTKATIDYLGLGMAVAMARAAAEDMDQPIALHLDHGASYELASGCMDAGYTSVMIDGSELPFEENCLLTRRVVELAHPRGVSVEGEIGHVGQVTDSADPAAFFTTPEVAARFVAETGVDALAVAVGTAHGFYQGEVQIDFERLGSIRAAIENTPLVLHGGSGVPDDLLRRAVRSGIRKINFGTELKDAFIAAVRKSITASDDIDLRRVFLPAVRAVEAVSAQKIAICTGREPPSVLQP
ncbi:MAG TPA: class II fructose-bisphosphate aldolase [Polyangiaceae bacterium]|jgi:ketose-bisphosphate aldolase